MAYTNPTRNPGVIDTWTVTVPTGTTTSTTIDLAGYAFVAFLLPSMTGATATIHGSINDSSYAEIVDDAGTALSITLTDSKWVTLSSALAAKLAPFRYIRLVSAGAEADTRTITIAAKR